MRLQSFCCCRCCGNSTMINWHRRGLYDSFLPISFFPSPGRTNYYGFANSVYSVDSYSSNQYPAASVFEHRRCSFRPFCYIEVANLHLGTKSLPQSQCVGLHKWAQMIGPRLPQDTNSSLEAKRWCRILKF